MKNEFKWLLLCCLGACGAPVAAQAQGVEETIKLSALDNTVVTPGGASCAPSSQSNYGVGNGASCGASAAMNADPGPQFLLTAIRIRGNRSVDAQELEGLYRDKLNALVNFNDLQEVAQRITQFYRDRGFFLAQAIVPVQSITGGAVEISVIEGVLGEVRINMASDAPIDEARVRKILAGLEPGKALDSARYERAMLLLSDLPGLSVRSYLEPGIQSGSTDLVIEINPSARLSTVVELDNYGSKATGWMRLGVFSRWASPARIGDNLDARLMVSEGSRMLFGRLAYELPVWLESCARAGLGISRVSYQLGKEYASLDARGTATVVDATFIYPLIRQRNHNLFIRAALESKSLTDEVRASDISVDKRVTGSSIGWSYELRDGLAGGGYWGSNGTLYHGSLSIQDEDARAADSSDDGAHTEGGFTKLTAQGFRLQSIAARHNVLVSIGMQISDKNLDASEKMSLGGPRGVRGYPSGEGLVDDGAFVNLEWRYALMDDMTVFAFYDFGSGSIAHHALPDSDNKAKLHSPGVGITWSRPNSFSFNATLAKRREPAATDSGKRGYWAFVQVQKTF